MLQEEEDVVTRTKPVQVVEDIACVSMGVSWDLGWRMILVDFSDFCVLLGFICGRRLSLKEGTI